MNFTIELVDQIAIPTLSVRRRSSVQDLPAVMGQAYGDIMQFAGGQGLKTLGPAFTIYYNMNMDDLDMEIGFVSKDWVPGNGIVQKSEIPAGKYVSALYTGPYAEMTKLYEAMSRFMIEKGLVPTGTACEFYFNSPLEVSENELKTQVLLGTDVAVMN